MNDCITTTNKAQQNRVHISWDILYILYQTGHHARKLVYISEALGENLI